MSQTKRESDEGRSFNPWPSEMRLAAGYTPDLGPGTQDLGWAPGALTPLVYLAGPWNERPTLGS